MFRTLFCTLLVAIGGGSVARAGVITFPDGDDVLVIMIDGDGGDNDCDVYLGNSSGRGGIYEWSVLVDLDDETHFISSDEYGLYQTVYILVRGWDGKDEMRVYGTLLVDEPEQFTVNFNGGDEDDTFEAVRHWIFGRTLVECRAFGEDGNDLLIGGDGADVLSGGDGFDQVRGEDGDDTVTGGVDMIEDDLEGGDGADLFKMIIETPVEVSGSWAYVVEQTENFIDFTPADGDEIYTLRRRIPRSSGRRSSSK